MTIKFTLRDDTGALHEVVMDHRENKIDEDMKWAVGFLKDHGIPMDNFQEPDLIGYEITLDFCWDIHYTSL